MLFIVFPDIMIIVDKILHLSRNCSIISNCDGTIKRWKMTQDSKLYFSASWRWSFLLLVIALCIMPSCKTTKNVYVPPTEENNVPKEVPEMPTEEDFIVVVPSDSMPEDLVKEDLVEEPLEEKKTFEIALMLPFQSQVYKNVVAQDTILDRSKLAVEFYEGVKIALDELKKDGNDYTIWVYDTQRDRATVDQLLLNPKMKDLDLIIGPAYNKTLPAVAEFGRRRQIPVISPFSPSAKFANDNPYFLAANPSLSTHCERLVDFLGKQETKHVIVMGTDKSTDLRLAQKVMEMHSTWSGEMGMETMEFDHIIYTDKLNNREFMDHFSKDQRNVVIMTTLKELPVSEMLGRLGGFPDAYEMEVYGMPTWENFQAIDLSYLEKLNVNITSQFYKVKSDPIVQKFENDYFLRNYTYPSDYACIGFDIMLFAGKLLNSNSDSVQEALYKTEPSGTFARYDFRSVKRDNSERTDYFENKYLHILRFENFRFNKID